MISIGVTTYATLDEAKAAARESFEMRKAGHAVEVYETYDHNDKFLSAFASHSAMCKKCRKKETAGAD